MSDDTLSGVINQVEHSGIPDEQWRVSIVTQFHIIMIDRSIAYAQPGNCDQVISDYDYAQLRYLRVSRPGENRP